jgi:vitamin B12 transporter
MTLRGGYTHLIASDDSNGLDLARTPRNTANASISLTPIDRLSLGLDVTYVDEQFNQSRQRQPLDGFTRLDIRAQYQLTDSLRIFARVDNATDRDYQVIRNAGTADRSAYLGIRADF